MANVSGVDAIVDWLVRGVPGAKTPAEVVARMCPMLVDAGVPVDRCEAFVRTLHPSVAGRRFVWTPGRDVEVLELSYVETHDPSMDSYAIVDVFKKRELAHRTITGADAPDLVRLKNEGYADWVGVPFLFVSGEVHGITFASKRTFSDDDVTALARIAEPLARVAEIFALLRTATNLLNAYVGHDAGARILNGQIQRGDTSSVRAVIWFSDLRGFTSMSSTLPPQKIIATLNDVFDCQVPSIEKRNGEVLKFMGDGMLAIFPVDSDEDIGRRCDDAIAAAREAFVNLETLNQRRAAGGDIAVKFGVALHIGDIAYGNIGGATRLDFTCIGPAVNLASRLEGLTSKLGKNVVVSEEVAHHAKAKFEDLGAFELKGVPKRARAFSIT